MEMNLYNPINKNVLSHVSTPERSLLKDLSDDSLTELFNLTEEEILVLYNCEMGGKFSSSLWPEGTYVYGYKEIINTNISESLSKKNLIAFIENSRPGGFFKDTGWYNTQRGHEVIRFIIKTQYDEYLTNFFLQNENLKNIITHASHSAHHDNNNLTLSVKKELTGTDYVVIDKFSKKINLIGLGDIGWHTNNIEQLIENLSKIKIEKDNLQNILNNTETVKSLSEFIKEKFND